MSNYLDPIVDKIVVARVGLLLRHPFFGNMATRLKIEDASEWCATAATDGRHLYYNKDFFADLSVKQVEFVVAHEILHNVFEHMLRVEGRDRKIWNIAADYSVNGTLTRDRIGEAPPKIKIFHDTAHYGKSSEQIYDEIYEQYDDEELAALGELLDEHIDWEKEGKNGQPAYSKEELKQIRDEIKEAMMTAAQAAGAGNVPAEIGRMIKELTEPKMNWREILRQQIQSTIKNDYTFMRPNRKGWHMTAILPGTTTTRLLIFVLALTCLALLVMTKLKILLAKLKALWTSTKSTRLNCGVLILKSTTNKTLTATAKTLWNMKLKVAVVQNLMPTGTT